MTVKLASFGNEFRQKRFEVSQNVGIGIFLNNQACGGVAQKERTQACLNLRCLNKFAHRAGDRVERFARCLDF